MDVKIKILKIVSILFVILLALISGFALGKYYPEQYSETDLLIIKSYILKEVRLNNEEFKHLDIDKDGIVSSRDYVLIKNKIIKDEKNEKK